MDTIHPGLRVVITDMVSANAAVDLEDSSGLRWRMSPSFPYHLTTPIVLPLNSGLALRHGGSSGFGTQAVTLIGRVVNL